MNEIKITVSEVIESLCKSFFESVDLSEDDHVVAKCLPVHIELSRK